MERNKQDQQTIMAYFQPTPSCFRTFFHLSCSQCGDWFDSQNDRHRLCPICFKPVRAFLFEKLERERTENVKRLNEEADAKRAAAIRQMEEREALKRQKEKDRLEKDGISTTHHVVFLIRKTVEEPTHRSCSPCFCDDATKRATTEETTHRFVVLPLTKKIPYEPTTGYINPDDHDRIIEYYGTTRLKIAVGETVVKIEIKKKIDIEF